MAIDRYPRSAALQQEPQSAQDYYSTAEGASVPYFEVLKEILEAWSSHSGLGGLDKKVSSSKGREEFEEQYENKKRAQEVEENSRKKREKLPLTIREEMVPRLIGEAALVKAGASENQIFGLKVKAHFDIKEKYAGPENAEKREEKIIELKKHLAGQEISAPPNAAD